MNPNRITLVGIVILGVASGSACAARAQTSTNPPTTRPAPEPASHPACTTPDDYTGNSVSGTFASKPEPLYAAGAAALRDLGFAVLENSPPRELITAPSYKWPAGTETEGWHGAEHPGVEIYLFTRTVADSTQVTIGARAICLVRGPGEAAPSATVGTSLESISALAAMKAFLARLQRAP